MTESQLNLAGKNECLKVVMNDMGKLILTFVGVYPTQRFSSSCVMAFPCNSSAYYRMIYDDILLGHAVLTKML